MKAYDHLAWLTEREGQVLSLLPLGLTNKKIAAKLCISEGAVEQHLVQIYLKLGISKEMGSPRALAIYYLHHGHLPDENT